MLLRKLLQNKINSFRALAMLVFLLLSACKSFYLPENISKKNGSYDINFSSELSEEAKFFYLSWYLELANPQKQDPTLADFLLKQKSVISETYHRDLIQNLVKIASPLVSLEASGGLRLNATIFAEDLDWDSAFDLLNNLQNALQQSNSTVKENELDFLFPVDKDKKLSFLQWLELEKPEILTPDKLDSRKILEDIDNIRATLSLKKHLLDSRSEADALLKSGEGRKALDLLDEVSNSLSVGSSLASIGDVKTLAEFEQAKKELPFKIIDNILQEMEKIISNTEETEKISATTIGRQISLLEKTISDSLHIWQEDKRFQVAFNKNLPRIKNIAAYTSKQRSKLWDEELALHCQEKTYWAGALKYQELFSLLQKDKVADFKLYFKLKKSAENDTDFIDFLKVELNKQYAKLLKDAFNEYFAAADYTSNIANKHGLCFAFCKMLLTMAEFADGANALPANFTEKSVEIKKFIEHSQKMMRQDGLQRSLVVAEMSSGIPGLGMTYAKDLENVLKAILSVPGLAPLISIAESGTAPSSRDYLIFGGIIADYDGKDVIERSTMRSITRYDEIQKIHNPDYNPEVNTNASLRQSAKYIYRQNELEQVIHIKEIERLAHLRIFFNIKGQGLSELLEINEFYSKKFVLEQSHLIEDVHKKRVIEAFNSAELNVPNAAPTLLNDRIWSTGEMLDFARKDSLNIFALKILYGLQDFPLFLQKRAEKFAEDKDLMQAAEYWGRCLYINEELKLNSDINALIKFDKIPVASSYPEDLQKLQDRQQELQELKKIVAKKTFSQACEYLRKRQNP